MRQVRIFVSHNRSDNTFCEALVKALRAAGADVWYDEYNLGAGRLTEEISRELEARPIFLVILSKAAIGSAWVRQECQASLSLLNDEPHRIILPVVAQLIESTDMRGVWLFLAPFKRVEAPGYKPYPQPEAIKRTLHELGLDSQDSQHADCQVPVGATPDELVADGKVLYNRRQYACSAMYCQRATQLNPDYFSAWYNLAYAYFELRRFDEGLAACERALALGPKNSHAWNLKGQFFTCLERDKEALTAFQRATDINPKVVRHWANLADTLNVLGRHADALAASEEAIRLGPNNYGSQSGRIAALAGLGRFDEALANVERILNMYPTHALLWNQKGLVLQRAGRHEEALAAFNHALALAPKNVTAWENRARTLAALGRDKEARDSRKKARELDEQGEGVVIFHGWRTTFG